MSNKPESETSLAELTQRLGPFARQQVVLFADRVEVRYEGLVRRWKHRVLLHNSKEKLDCVRNPISAAVVVRFVLLLLAAAVFWPLAPFLAYFVVKFFQGRRRMYVLAYGTRVDRLGRSLNFPLFFVLADEPTPAAVQKFLAALGEAHKSHTRKIQIAQSEAHYITEIKQFHELKQEGVLTEEEFGAIKAELLGMRRKRIGF